MALQMLADAADGSLRDALSLLDQAIVYGGGQVVLSAVSAMLGTVVQQPVNELLLLLAQHDTKGLLDKIAELAELTPNFGDILQRMLKLLHRLAVLQQLPDFIDNDYDPVVMQTLLAALSPEDIQLFYQMGIIGLRDLPLAPDPQTGFEMVLLRMMAFRPQGLALASDNAPKLFKPKPQPVTTSAPDSLSKPSIAAPPAVIESDWQRIIQALALSGRTKELANNCVLDQMDDNECRLLIDPSFQRIGTKAEDNLRAALQNHFGKPLKLVISNGVSQQLTPALEQQKAQSDKQQAAVDSIQADATVESINTRFGARILPGTIEPLT
jgi:DNA polymerase-3 subunit gamma/tau